MKKTAKKTAAPVSSAAPAKSAGAKTATATTAAPAPKPVTSAATKPAMPPTAIPTTIEANIDVGFGNSLFARGQGAGLSWDHGIPLTNVDSQTWRLTVPAADKLQFKLLINDSIWAQGEDVVVTPGKSIKLTPSF